MKTITDLKAEQAAELAKLERETAIAASLPVPATHITSHGDCVSVKHAKKYPDTYTFAEAVAILAQYAANIVTAEHWNDGCVSCRPVEINSCAKAERARMDGQHAVELELNAGKGYSGHALSWWARIGGELLSVSVEISPEWKWLPQTEFSYDSRGDCTKSKVSAMGLGEDSQRKWWSSPGSYKLSYYWADMHNFNSWASHELTNTRKATA
jgi:hypothetical protein